MSTRNSRELGVNRVTQMPRPTLDSRRLGGLVIGETPGMNTMDDAHEKFPNVMDSRPIEGLVPETDATVDLDRLADSDLDI